MTDLTTGRLAAMFGLPAHVVVSLWDRGVLLGTKPAKRYPGQHRSVPASEVAAIRQRLVSAGYISSIVEHVPIDSIAQAAAIEQPTGGI